MNFERSCRRCKHYRGERTEHLTLIVYPSHILDVKEPSRVGVNAPYYVIECDIIPHVGIEKNLHVTLAKECPFYEEKEARSSEG